MRTTLSIDDDVLVAVKELARRQKRSTGEVLSELARAALNHGYPQPNGREPRPFHGFQPFPHRGRAVSNALIDQIRDDEAS